jgi:hypothetical protein
MQNAASKVRSLQPCILLSPFLCNLLLGELLCLTLQHFHLLLVRKLHLVAHGHQTTREMIIILPQQVDGEEHVVDVVEHEGVLIRVLLLLREKRHWVVSPVTKWVKMVRGVIAVIVAVSVALFVVSFHSNNHKRGLQNIRGHR